MTERMPIIAGNWKMHHDHYQAIQVTQKLSYQLDKTDYERVEVVICPPFTDLRSLQTIIDADSLPIVLGAQNCHFEESGAFTGEISPVFLAKLGVRYVIVGHSERRELFGESDEDVNRKAKAVIKHGMTPILCCGETLDEREAGGAEDGDGRCATHAHHPGFAIINQTIAITAPKPGKPNANQIRNSLWYASGSGAPSAAASAARSRPGCHWRRAQPGRR